MNEDAKMFLEVDGKEVEATVLFTCYLEETDKNYVVFIAENPKTKVKEVSAAVYSETDDFSGNLSPVETDEEWEILDDYFDEFANENDLDIDSLLK